MAKVSRRALAHVVAEKLLAKGSDAKAIMRELAAFLVANNLVDDTDMVINDIADELFQLSGRLSVEVTSAHTLTDDARSRLDAFLRQATGAESVELYEEVDPALLGGLVAKTPSAELDVSVRNKLRQLTALA